MTGSEGRKERGGKAPVLPALSLRSDHEREGGERRREHRDRKNDAEPEVVTPLLTGQLGDVMKESATAGISYIRSVAARYGINQEFFQENDIHVHIPEGAVPKDGPSAGITMATAMLSAIIDKPVRADLAMTGEITLRGRVLPIGGLKEKLLAAKYAKIKEVLVPKSNKPDIKELDEEITDGLKITFVENMNEVLERALA